MFEKIVSLLQNAPLNPVRELDLQLDIVSLFDSHGIEYTREHSLSDKDRIDFSVGDIGIECKVSTSPLKLARQVSRYTKYFKKIIVVSAQKLELPTTICDVPVTFIPITQKTPTVASTEETYGKVEFLDNKWLVHAQPQVMMRITSFFPSALRVPNKGIRINHTASVCCDLLWFMERYPMDVSPEDLQLIHQKAIQAEVARAERNFRISTNHNPPTVKLATPLRKYQEQAVDIFLKASHRLLLADGVGLGKTATAIGAIVAGKAYPALIVCQTHLPPQFVRELQKFAPDLTTHIIKTMKVYELPPADIYIISYSKLASWMDTLLGIPFLVFDEVQELRRGNEAQKGVAAADLSKSAKYVLGLSATPVMNYGVEIFSIMEIIAPGSLGSLESFRTEWCVLEGMRHKVINPEALGITLRDEGLILRRTAEDCKIELPPVHKVRQVIPVHKDELKSHKAKIKELYDRSHTSDVFERGRASGELTAFVRMQTGISKAVSVARFVKENILPEKTILFGWHRDVYEIWEEEFKDYCPRFITGSESPKQKEENLTAFKEGDCALLIISNRSGAGIDGLQYCCHNIVVGEYDYSPKQHEQNEGRLARFGQDKVVSVYYLAVEHGTDPIMETILGIKEHEGNLLLASETMSSSSLQQKVLDAAKDWI